jgi:hypothetical protein
MSTKNQIKNSVFNNLKKVMNQPSLTYRQLRYIAWMKNTVKSEYFHDTESIKNAVLKVV